MKLAIKISSTKLLFTGEKLQNFFVHCSFYILSNNI